MTLSGGKLHYEKKYISIGGEYCTSRNMMPAQAFDTPTKRKVLRVMAEEPRKLTIDGLADSCHRSESSISRALTDLSAYPFIEEERVEGSKQRVYGFDLSSRYTEPILDFFEVEKTVERQAGRIPVYIWNLLEDLATEMESRVENFIEVFLFGSYATGNFYTGSDIDLFLLVEPPEEVGKHQGRKAIDKLAPDEDVQLIVGAATSPMDGWDPEAIDKAARVHSPLDAGEPLIPLLGQSP